MFVGISGIPGAQGLPGEPGRPGQDGLTGQPGLPGQKVCIFLCTYYIYFGIDRPLLEAIIIYYFPG